jgi:TPR repeat protein
LGVPRDYGEAAHWYKESALQGNVLAMRDLALLFHRGFGVEQSFISAYAWMNIASAQEGWSVLGEYRDQFEKEMTSDQIAEAQALSSQLHQQLSARNHPR